MVLAWPTFQKGFAAMQSSAQLGEFDMQWQPIETAPRDGRQLLLCSPAGITISPWPPVELTVKQKKQFINDMGWPDNRKWVVTHWMPLPDNPHSADGSNTK